MPPRSGPVNTSSRVSQPSSSSASVRFMAGSRRMTVWCVQLTSSLRSMQPRTTAVPSMVSSRPIITPLTRTSWIHAPLALDRLDEDGARLAVDEAGGGVQVAVGGVAEAGEQRLQPLVVLGLARRAQGAERAAVEAVQRGDDLVAAGLAVQPGELDG